MKKLVLNSHHCSFFACLPHKDKQEPLCFPLLLDGLLCIFNSFKNQLKSTTLWLFFFLLFPVKPMWNPSCLKFFSLLLHLSVVTLLVSAEDHGNPANEIVELINQNRTSSKLPKLYDSAGLGCMALQYISECTGNCSKNNTMNCRPPEVDITEVYAPNCGVELPTVGIISGHLLGCHWNDLSPEQAFSSVLIQNKQMLTLLHSKEHTEVGVGFSRTHGGPNFWCALFSSGKENSSFVLEGGQGIKQRSGCFSGIDLPCSTGTRRKLLFSEIFMAVVLVMLLSCSMES